MMLGPRKPSAHTILYGRSGSVLVSDCYFVPSRRWLSSADTTRPTHVMLTLSRNRAVASSSLSFVVMAVPGLEPSPWRSVLAQIRRASALGVRLRLAAP